MACLSSLYRHFLAGKGFMNTPGCFYLALVSIAVLLAARKVAADHECKNVSVCRQISSEYTNCCQGKCSRRAYCSGLCVYDSNCDKTKHEKCSSKKQCAVDFSTRPPDYCRLSIDCPSKQMCRGNGCVDRITSMCHHCNADEVCKDGKCVKQESDNSLGFSPASIAGLTVVVVIGSCVACILYCVCGRRRNGQPQGQQTVQAPANQNHTQQQPVITFESQERGPTHAESIASIAEIPLPANAPPPYHSIDFNEQSEPERAPPTYQEALRNSKNDLNHV